MTKWRLTLLLGVLCLTAVTLFWHFEIRRADDKKAARQAELRLHPTDEFSAIHIITQADSISISKDTLTGQWRMTSPVDYTADQAVMGDVVNAILSAKFIQIVDSIPRSLENYGLNPPTIAIRTSESEFTFGAMSPTGSGYYAQISGDTRVLLVSGTVFNALNLASDAFRSKDILPTVQLTDLDSVRISRDFASDQSFRRDGFEWQITSPVSGKAYNQIANNVISGLAGVKASAFIADSHSRQILDSLGLDQIATFEYWGANDIQETLHIYARFPESGDSIPEIIAAANPNRDPLFEIPLYIWRLLNRPVDQFRDRQILTVNDADGFSIVQANRGRIEFDILADGWALVFPETVMVNQAQVKAFLKTFSGLTIDSFITRNDFSQPEWQIEFIIGDEKKILEIGEKDSNLTQIHLPDGAEYYKVFFDRAEPWLSLNPQRFGRAGESE